MRAATLRRALVLSAAVAALGACTTTNSETVSPARQSAVWDGAIRGEVEQQLAQSASRAANALETLAMIQRVRTEPVATPIDEAGLPPELARQTTIQWSGPAIGLVKELAASIGYSFLESGNRPATNANVSVDIRDRSAAKAFEDIGLQVQAFATVIVDPNQQRVEFRHETAAHALPAAPPAKGAPSLKPRATK